VNSSFVSSGTARNKMPPDYRTFFNIPSIFLSILSNCLVRLFTAAGIDWFELGDLVGGAAGAIVVGAIVGGAVGATVVTGSAGGDVGGIVVGGIVGAIVGGDVGGAVGAIVGGGVGGAEVGVGAGVGAAPDPDPGVSEISSIAMSPKNRAHLCVMIPII